MGLFDNLLNEAESIGGKVGLSPDQVQAIANTVQTKLASSGGNTAAALEAAAAEHGVSVSQIQEMLNHGGGLTSQLGSLAGGLFKSGQ